MYCKNCGTQLEEGSSFCTKCGTDAQEGAKQTVTATQPAPEPVKPKKKRHIGRWIALAIVLLLGGGAFYVFASMSILPPKDLGVRYTQKDFNTAMQKTGVHITADLGDGITYDNKEILAGSATATGYKDANNASSVKLKDLNINDYNFEFTKYERKTIKMTNVEVSAFFNEVAPGFWWFKNTQVSVKPDGTIVTSSTVDIAKLKRELYSDVASKIPVPLPDKANLYTEGSFSVTNNKISMVPKVMSAGAVTLPDQYKSGTNVQIFSSYLDRLYTVVPKLQVNRAYVENGQFIFDGTVPTEVKVTPKKK